MYVLKAMRRVKKLKKKIFFVAFRWIHSDNLIEKVINR
ncbi:hypothetical protein S3E15_01505 [Bacillus mycoides]|uniref:Uncharacterized protein n=1 Tax=Bacillus mycoides TaxID=1405 RepID=A0AAP7W5L8_BACMY|nr:hypothetical protein M2E15_2717 [Bacillus mycoides]OSX89201.1 hypothetical protein BTJ44_04885 [Bacillus mycoides]OSX90877.1 hypothetical protein S3E15_01505 [Bacillus mycoides]OSY03567.1 hypothetical protein S2E19_02791 [Bacillus mycoides]OSY10326.1 hypothetical protein BTJ48_01930 [Bacillus mycoides]